MSRVLRVVGVGGRVVGRNIREEVVIFVIFFGLFGEENVFLVY